MGDEPRHPGRRAITGTRYTRTEYLMVRMMAGGVPWYAAREAVASVAIEHPEWDMNERRSWTEWESDPAVNR